MAEKIGTELQISVIIMCFNRKDFLLNAIKSVLRQTLTRDKYEIVVTKNFQDLEIDSYISQNNIYSIAEGDVGIGTMVANAVEKTRGKYVSFLDDDDLFYPDKLSTIYEKTLKDPSIVYYHNSFNAIDSDGANVLDFRHCHPFTPLLINDGCSHLSVRKVKNMSGDINMSSITVRRDLLLKSIQFIRDITGLQDVFLFYLSALSHEKMMFDSDILTGYRIHTSESHGNLAEFDRYSAGMRSVLLKYLRSYEILLNKISAISTDIKYEYLTNKCRYQLMVPQKTGLLSTRELIYLLMHIRFASDIRNQIILIAFGFFHLLMPKKITNLYIHRKIILDGSRYSRNI